jgi:hypothetical protein
MIELKPKFWVSGTELTKIKNLMAAWWAQVEGWIRWPMTQLDAETAMLGIVDLMAFERNIDRFTTEPELLYRRRVKYAFQNAKDAGSAVGFVKIFDRLGLGYIEVSERVAGLDWDIIVLNMSDATLAENIDLLDFIVGQYGRTCRRYQYQTLTPVSLYRYTTEFNNDYQTFVLR